MRKGRSFIVRDQGVDHTLILQPVKPQGYVFIRSGKLMYCGCVFSEAEANLRIASLTRNINLRAQLKGSDFASWLETTAFLEPIMPIETPKEAIRPSQDSLDASTVSTEPHIFNPVIADGILCMSCNHFEQHSIHIKEERPVIMPHMLPAHYSTPEDRQAAEEDQEVIIEHSSDAITATLIAEGAKDGTL